MWTAPALVDWCEPNYAVTPHVAEWWNTLSSGAMVAIGLYGFWRVRDAALRFRLGMLGLAAVGAGSAAFHGTLLRAAQAADELPMVWLGLACVWALADRARAPGEGRSTLAALVAFGAAFCVAYATVPWAFALFVGVYATMVAWVALRTIQLTWGAPSSPAIRRAAATMIGTYLGSFFLCWFPEHVLLGCDHPLQALQLHSFWHVGGAVGTVAWWEWARLDRERAYLSSSAVNASPPSSASAGRQLRT
ncbi:MAG: ceramidase domain-containing protein [Myxococcota bacterium]